MLIQRTAGAVVASLLLVTPVADAAKRRSCGQRGSDTIAANAKARIYAVTDRNTGFGGKAYVYYGCLRRDPKPVHLAMEYMSGSGGGGLGLFLQLRGRFAGFAQLHYGPGDGDGEYEVAAVDLKTRRKVRSHSDSGFVHALVLTRSASLAFVTSRYRGFGGSGAPREGYTVWKAEAHASTAVDTGDEIDPRSLALSRSWMYWMHAGQPRAAPIE